MNLSVHGLAPSYAPWSPPQSGPWGDTELRIAADALAEGASWQAAARKVRRTYEGLHKRIQKDGGIEAFIAKHRSGV